MFSFSPNLSNIYIRMLQDLQWLSLTWHAAVVWKCSPVGCRLASKFVLEFSSHQSVTSRTSSSCRLATGRHTVFSKLVIIRTIVYVWHKTSTFLLYQDV